MTAPNELSRLGAASIHAAQTRRTRAYTKPGKCSEKTLMAGAGTVAKGLLLHAVRLRMAVAFTGAWSAQAAPSDESGLWVVGAFLVLIGTAAGAAVVAGASRLIRHRSASAR